MKKILLYMLLATLTARVSPLYAVLPGPRTLGDDVKDSSRIFVGLAKKVTVTKIAEVKSENMEEHRSRKVLPPPPGIYCSFLIEVEIIQALKSGPRKLPPRLKLTMQRVYSSKREMQSGLAARQSEFVNRHHIYLVSDSDDYFSIESLDKKHQIQRIIKQAQLNHRNSKDIDKNLPIQ